MGQHVVEDLTGGFGPIFLNLDAGKTDGGGRLEGIGRTFGDNAQIEGLGGGPVTGEGELIGLAKAGGGEQGMFGELLDKFLIKAGSLAMVFLGGSTLGGIEDRKSSGGLAGVFADQFLPRFPGWSRRPEAWRPRLWPFQSWKSAKAAGPPRRLWPRLRER